MKYELTPRQVEVATPAGMMLVPVEPTPEMLRDAQEACGMLGPILAGRVWSAMLAAAPKVAAEDLAVQAPAEAHGLTDPAILKEAGDRYMSSTSAQAFVNGALYARAVLAANVQPKAAGADVLALAHRIAWRYKKSSDPHHSDTYTFNRDTLLQFAEAVRAANVQPKGMQPEADKPGQQEEREALIREAHENKIRARSFEANARRYRRLQILGAAPFGSMNLDQGTVLRFQSLDAFVDADIEAHPSRGESTQQDTAPNAQAIQAPAPVAGDYKQAPGSKNCMQSAVAYMLGLPMDAVPDFEKAGPDAWESFYAFFSERGFTAEMFPPNVEIDGDYLASGSTERGTSHMVVMRGWELLHDPHPSNSGLTSPQVVWVIARKAGPYPAVVHTEALALLRELHECGAVTNWLRVSDDLRQRVDAALRDASAHEKAHREPLTDAQIEAGREATFSTSNPFCPCDSKTMRKAVRWAEHAHGIGKAQPPVQGSQP